MLDQGAEEQMTVRTLGGSDGADESQETVEACNVRTIVRYT